MYNHLESERAKVLISRAKLLQSWLRSELVRKMWLKTKECFVNIQAAHRGRGGRVLAAGRAAEVNVERQCAAALSIRKEPLCVAAIEAAEALGYFPPSLDQVRFVIDRIRDEKEVEDMLRHATFTKQQEDVEEALKAVAALKLDEAWANLPAADDRAGLIPRARTLKEQLTKYAGLMQTLAGAMKVGLGRIVASHSRASTSYQIRC